MRYEWIPRGNACLQIEMCSSDRIRIRTTELFISLSTLMRCVTRSFKRSISNNTISVCSVRKTLHQLTTALITFYFYFGNAIQRTLKILDESGLGGQNQKSFHAILFSLSGIIIIYIYCAKYHKVVNNILSNT